MALLQKKTPISTQAPLYKLGLSKTVLIIGLGNPGKKYEATRHNIGFACVDTFAASQDFPQWIAKKDLQALVTLNNVGASRVVLVKPTTFMNLSGQATQAVQQFYKVPPQQILVVHDELDIPFGQIRIRSGGGSAGHNGVTSLIEHIGDDFGRVRIGIGNEDADFVDGAKFVLQKFTKEERPKIPALTREVTTILTEYLYSGNLTPETRTFLV